MNVVQYFRPHGERQVMLVDIGPDYEDRAQMIIASGFVFEAEVLTTQQVSVTITGKNTDIDIEVIRNGPEVIDALRRMIDRFDLNDAIKMDEGAE